MSHRAGPDVDAESERASRPPSTDPVFVARVMDAIATSRPSLRTRIGNFCFGRRALVYSLATGIPAAACVALVLVYLTRVGHGGSDGGADDATARSAGYRSIDLAVTSAGPAPGHGESTDRTVVRFRHYAPEARSVALLGDFNDWRPSSLFLEDDDGDGVWTLTLALGSGRYAYNFIVDGTEWVVDPNAEMIVADGFGGRSAILSL